MRQNRRIATVVALALAAGSGMASAQSYPTKPIRMLIPFAAGGFSDVVARVVAQKLADSVGQPVVIDNRPGASGLLGTEIAAKSQPDGYTLLFNSFNHVVNPALLKTPYDSIRDFASVSLIADGPPLVMMVNPATPMRTVKDLIALAKSRPGEINWGSTGVGTSGHLIGEFVKLATGVNMVHVPYRGTGASMAAVLSGEVAMVSAYMPVALPQVQSGRMRALAVTGPRRSAIFPDVPTMEEAGVPGVIVTGFAGLLAPAGTPKGIVMRLNAEIVKMAKDPDFVKRYASYDMEPVGSTPEAFVKYMQDEIAKWSRVVRAAGIAVQ